LRTPPQHDYEVGFQVSPRYLIDESRTVLETLSDTKEACMMVRKNCSIAVAAFAGCLLTFLCAGVAQADDCSALYAAMNKVLTTPTHLYSTNVAGCRLACRQSPLLLSPTLPVPVGRQKEVQPTCS
jgi:hypothetical protein